MIPEKATQSFTVFLCHAAEDQAEAENLYRRLAADGIHVWYAGESLLPGQTWEMEISRALRTAHAVIVCLSDQLIKKEGFIQKELKQAFEIALEKPDGAIYIIPVKLEDCEIPARFSGIHHVDIHKADGYKKITAALVQRAESLGMQLMEPKKKQDTDHELAGMLKNMLRSDQDLQEELEHLSQQEPDGDGWFHRAIRRELLSLMEHASKPAAERARAAEVLAQVGDPRFRADAWFLPNDSLLGLLEVPAGQFVMGNPAQTNQPGSERESPQHTLHLPAFYISRYPVTVAQYSAFLEATSKPGRKTDLKLPANQPVTEVTWQEALTYCRWLTETLCQHADLFPKISRLLNASQADGLPWVVTLPSEAEWEKAARGQADARPYPWGALPDPDRANYQETGLKKIAPVGCVPGGESPYQVREMSGNVCEWTRTSWGPDIGRPLFRYPYDPLDEREDPDPHMQKVHRGGSWYDAAKDIRCSSRAAADPNAAYKHIGFRLVLTLRQQR